MSIYAINGNLIKSQIPFKNDEHDRFKEFRDYTYKIKDNSVKKIEDMKKPFDVAWQVAAMSTLAYLSVQCAVSGALSRFAPNLSVSIEKVLRNSANAVKNKSDKLKAVEPNGLFSNLKNKTGKVTGKIENWARNIYKGIAYRGLPETMVNPERANNAFGNIIGTGAFGYTLYNICTKDEDNDGVKDVFQQKHSILSAIIPTTKE